MSKPKFTTIGASRRLMSSMEIAIENMIEEIKKPVDPEINGSARKAELQSIKQVEIYNPLKITLGVLLKNSQSNVSSYGI